jgi:hypothetical protein
LDLVTGSDDFLDEDFVQNHCHRQSQFRCDLYLDQKVESMTSGTSWTVEINGGGLYLHDAQVS